MLLVEKNLPHRCDHAHQRARITPLITVVCLKTNMLKHIRLEDNFVWVRVRQRYQRARSANNSSARRNHSRRESQLPQWCERFIFRRIIPRGPVLRRNLRDLVTRPWLSKIRLLPWSAKELDRK